MGTRVTSTPRRIRAAARVLSWMQLPQYMPPAPAVMQATLTVAQSGGKKRSTTERSGGRVASDTRTMAAAETARMTATGMTPPARV